MTHDQFNLLSVLQNEHQSAIRFLTALDEGDTSVLPAVHAFLQQVKARKEAARVAKSVKAANQERRKKVGRKNSGNFEIAARLEGGADHGATGLVLARKGNVRLIWRSGAKFWANQLEGYVYSPGNLVLSMTGDRGSRGLDDDLTKNHRNSGGEDTRLSRKLIEKFSDRIDAVFGVGVAAEVAKLKTTIQVPDADGG